MIYIIECRHPDGSLDFKGPQPENYFGDGAIRGMTEDHIAKAIFRTKPAAIFDGRNVALWPRQIDPRWTARQKTWR